MHPEYRKRFPAEFPLSLVDSARPLEKELESILSLWKYEDIKNVINYLVDKQYIILGGDVYLEEPDQLYLTYDNWYLQKAQGGSWKLKDIFASSPIDKKRALEWSREQSLRYVDNYWKRNGDKYYYSVVFKFLPIE